MSFEKMERLVNDDGIATKLGLPSKYMLSNVLISDKKTLLEGTIEFTYQNGAREIILKNGMKKRVYEDGVIVIQLVNGDIKMINSHGIEKYIRND
jgi:hypothetical protein